jgi:hypothetical protein
LSVEGCPVPRTPAAKATQSHACPLHDWGIAIGAELGPNRCPLQRQRASKKSEEEETVSDKRPSVKNEKQYEALKDKGMSKQRAARIANSPGASSRGGKKSGSGSSPRQGGTAAQKREAGRKGGRAAAAHKS